MAMTLPQLRVRTEFSFKSVFGHVDRVARALAAIDCPRAAIVDSGTWGHVRWSKACKAAGIAPMFGTELPVPQADGRKPLAWILAESLPDFYRLSTAARAPGADVAALFAHAKGVIRFAGAALTDPETFDYVDVNPASPLRFKAALALAKKTGKPMVMTGDNFYPTPTDLDAFLAFGGRERASPQHILTAAEMKAWLGARRFNQMAANTCEAAARATTELRQAPLIQIDASWSKLIDDGRKARAMPWNDTYQARLDRELDVIRAKRFESYFIVVADLVTWAKGRMLVGPGRGSAAGSLVCYLLGITEVDPIQHGLLFERFIDLTRSDLPDIDIDFSDAHRDECFEYLAEKYGRANVARLGSINLMKPRTVINQVSKAFGIGDSLKLDFVDSIIEHAPGDNRFGHSLEDTLTQTNAGQKLIMRYPAAAVMTQLENHASHSGVHAAGVIVSNVRVDEFCTVGPDGIAHLDKPDAESLNLLKIDALGLRTLGIIEDAGVVTAAQLYGLPLDDPKVFETMNMRKLAGIFQFEGQTMRKIAGNVQIDDFKAIDHITALARPGPLSSGAADRYIARKAGLEATPKRHPKLDEILADTFGIVLYQEQVMSVVRELGGFSWADTTAVRKAIGGRKGREFLNKYEKAFIAGAGQDIGPELWDELVGFGAYGMNRAHTCSYAIISYWCAWLKTYYPVEFAAACLRNAKDDDQTLSILREVTAEGIAYCAFDAQLSESTWSVKDGRLIGGFNNLVGFGPVKAARAIAQRREGKLDLDKIAKAEVKFADLFPLRNKFAALYADPESFGCLPGSKVLTYDELPEEGDVLFLGTVINKTLRDENEPDRVARRDGRLMIGPTKFVNLTLQDDSAAHINAKIGRRLFRPLGEQALEGLLRDVDVVLVRGRKVPGFNVITVDRIRCLTNPEVFQ